MSLPYFFKNTRRLRFFLFVLAIMAPILAITIFWVSRSEDNAAFKGLPDDKGGTNYIYNKNSGFKELPPAVAKHIALYPNAEYPYMKVNISKQGNPGGSIYGYTKDDFSKVAAFYKNGRQLRNESADRIDWLYGNGFISVEKVTTQSHDPIQGQNKFKIFFANKD